MATKITVQELEAMQNAAKPQLVDICSPTEYAAGHLPGAISIPMEQMEARLGDLSTSSPLVLVCKSGQRAAAAAQILSAQRKDVLVLEGGARAWSRAGNELVMNTRTRWSLERQVRLGAGLLVLTGVALSLMWNPAWIALTAFVGLGLTFAGATDICGMALLLARMPWNRAKQHKAVPIAEAGTDHKCTV